MSHLNNRLVSHVRADVVAPENKIHVIAYRSVGVSVLTELEVQRLLRASQARNKAAGLTGVLICDNGAYFQWLEGPVDQLSRVWNSILHDPRHHQIEVLRDEDIDARVFEGWDLRLAIGSRTGVEAAVAAMESSSHKLKETIGRPKSIVELSWEELFATIVIPRLREVHGRDVVLPRRLVQSPAIWHAEWDSGAKLANVLLTPSDLDAARYVDTLLDQGANFNALYREVFEPAQVHLGKLWEDDRCDNFHLSIGLARMQLELMRVHTALPAEHLCKPGLSILLSSQPNESHRVGLAMSHEVFNRSGWDVVCEIPRDDQSLGDLLHGHWFDVLKLSQSGALRRDSRLPAMRATIDAARAASMNPSLIVMVDGRTFSESPLVYHAIHANAMSVSVVDAAPQAERLLEASRTVTAAYQVSTG